MKTKMKIMKIGLFLLFLSFTFPNFAQEKSSFSVGGDLVSSYIWRGSKIGSGPNLQPYVEFSAGNFSLGSWGSFSLHQGGDFMEADLYASYIFDFGISLGLTDYFYQGSPYFRYDTDSASHALELNLGYELGSLSIAANYIVNDASNGGPANIPGGGDMFLELGYSFLDFDLFIGAGNGWHTSTNINGDDKFSVCNIGISTSKEIIVSDTFSLPVRGTVSINPDKEEFNIVLGFSL